MDERDRPRPKVRLIGEDGNAFNILGKTIRALRKAGYPEAEIHRYREAATSGNYDHLLATTMEWVDVE